MTVVLAAAAALPPLALAGFAVHRLRRARRTGRQVAAVFASLTRDP